MKRYIIRLLCALGFLMFAPGIATAGDIVVTLFGDDAYPPYSFNAEGKADGIYPEIIRRAAVRMEGFSVAIELLPWRRLLKKAETGEAFAVFPPYYRPMERKYLTAYSVPILREKTAVFCNTDTLASPRPNWPQDYYGLHIGKNLSFSTGGAEFDQAVEKGLILLEEIPGTELNIRKLLEGRIDCYINDRLAVLWTIKRQDRGNYKYSNKIMQGAVISSEQGFVAYSSLNAPEYRERFITAFDQAILSLKAEGVIDSIVTDFTH